MHINHNTPFFPPGGPVCVTVGVNTNTLTCPNQPINLPFAIGNTNVAIVVDYLTLPACVTVGVNAASCPPQSSG